MARRFVAVPEVPDGILDWEAILLAAQKENIELLCGTRGETDGASIAVVRGDITTENIGQQDLVSVTLSGDDGYNISSQDVASLNALRNLREDVQVLTNDLFRTRAALDFLIKNLKGA
tara:strand:+ start:129 stop:482 length:354 start_codon:yes stop_codon:yes gene_type:complete